MSARRITNTKIRQPHVCVFIRAKRGIDHVLFNLKSNQIEPSTKEQVLDLLSCSPDEKKDTVRVNQVETAAIKAFEAWLEQQSEEDKLFPNERVCVVYLRPDASQEPANAISKMLNDENASPQR